MLSDQVLNELPQEIVNELAILEDRAIRAEARVERQADKVAELMGENATLRTALNELQVLAHELQTRAEEIADAAQADAASIEDKLRRVLVIQAQ